MASDYNKIREENIIEYGRGTRHLSYLGRLYTDRTHFVFELLQNAEDAGASQIFFMLFDDRLEVYHNGRLFNEFDVRGVSGIAEGTKAEDLTQIGKFGIGFKSVYAYTSNPEVHSGSENFRIENFVRPYLVNPRQYEDKWTTLFVFPFDTAEIDPKNASQEIGNRLSNLNARTLLFLRSVTEIEYKLPNSTGGIYLREEIIQSSYRQVLVIGQNNDVDEEEKWIVFERPVTVPDGTDKIRVEVGFQMVSKEKEGKEYIETIKNSPLFVFFPTEKFTRFGFLIQGPYRTTPARDNIPKDDNWNKTLIKETSVLITQSLHLLKKFGFLNVTLLDALPIKIDDFPEYSMFYPIFTAVRESLMYEDLLPTDDDSFVSAHNAKLASAEWLRSLLRGEQLSYLFKTEISLKWISGEITDRVKFDLRKYLRDELKIEEITPDSFARKVDVKFFEKQTDNWVIEFYKQLLGQNALWKKSSYSWGNGPLLDKPFIRLNNGSHVKPFKKDNLPNAYLAIEENYKSFLPVVKTTITQQEAARKFLLDLGIPELDIVAEVIEYILPKYLDEQVNISFEENSIDIEKINKAFKTDSSDKKDRLERALKNSAFILSENIESDKYFYKKPYEIYFPEEILKMYFSGNSDVSFICSKYDKSLDSFFRKLKVNDNVQKTKKDADNKRNINIINYHGFHKRGLNGFDPDIKIDGLQHALNFSTLEKSKFIWNDLVIPNLECISGIVETSTRQTYEYSEKQDCNSEFGSLLMENKWLPGKDGQFYFPRELYLENLPEQFERNEKLADLLGMKKDVISKLADEAGIAKEDIDLLRKYPEEFFKWKKQIYAQNEKPVFPTKEVKDLDRRQERVSQQWDEALDKKYEIKQRSERITRNAIEPSLWLEEYYINKDEQMVCQICKKEMPFKKRNGKYYFEAVEVLSKDHVQKEHESLCLALCPLCAAMYKEFIKKDEAETEKLKISIMSPNDLEIPIMLGEWQTSIQFVEAHLEDLKLILKKENEL